MSTERQINGWDRVRNNLTYVVDAFRINIGKVRFVKENAVQIIGPFQIPIKRGLGRVLSCCLVL